MITRISPTPIYQIVGDPVTVGAPSPLAAQALQVMQEMQQKEQEEAAKKKARPALRAQNHWSGR